MAVAPPPTDANGRFVYAVQKGDEETAINALHEIDAARAVLNPTKGSYAIHLACQQSLERVIRALLNIPGVDLTFIDSSGNTPLHYACMSTNQTRALGVVKMLVQEFKASPTAKNSMGQTPYDLALLDSVRQFLLPIQLQAETQHAIDNGGVGLPPGIDMGGMRIKNPAAPPPPIMSMQGGHPHPAPKSSPAPHAYQTPQHDPIPNPPSSGDTGYALSGGSSAAIYKPKDNRKVYKADGFHSSSSDVNLQRKYGHVPVGGVAGSAPPPPSSGNGPVSMTSSGPNPFAGNSNPYASGGTKSRYVAYDAVTNQVSAVPAATGGFSAPLAAPTPNYAVFSPAGVAPAPVYQQPGQQQQQQQPAELFSPVAAPDYGQQPQAQPQNVYSGVQQQPQTIASTDFSQPNNAPGTTFHSPPAITTPAPATTQPAMGGSQGPIPAAPVSGGFSLVEQQANAKSSAELFASPSKIEDAAPAEEPAPAPALNSVPAGPASASDLFASPVGTTTTTTTSEPAASEPAIVTAASEPTVAAPAATQPEEDATTSAEPLETTTTTAAATTTMNTTSEASSSLPEGWLEVTDPASGSLYYVNTVDNTTSWDRPQAQPTATQAVSTTTAANSSGQLPEGWMEVTDPASGNLYYYNTKDNTTSWDRPQMPSDTPAQEDTPTTAPAAVEPQQPATASDLLDSFAGAQPASSEVAQADHSNNQSVATDLTKANQPPVSASDLFASPSKDTAMNNTAGAAPQEENQQPALSANQRGVVEPAPTSGAHELFGSPAAVDPQSQQAIPAETQAQSQSRDEGASSPSNSDELLDVPLSPDKHPVPVDNMSQPAVAAAATNQGFSQPSSTVAPSASQGFAQSAPGAPAGADSLFAAIGMPPPPFIAKR